MRGGDIVLSAQTRLFGQHTHRIGPPRYSRIVSALTAMSDFFQLTFNQARSPSLALNHARKSDPLIKCRTSWLHRLASRTHAVG
jgi:hypothetical protein